MKKRMKKAISPLIATILIVGFTIVLAALVMRWTGTFFTTTTTETGEASEVAITCVSNIQFSVQDSCIEGNKIKILVQNKGTQPINAFIFQVFGRDTLTTSTPTGLAVYASDNFLANYTSIPFASLPNEIERVKIFPKILVNGEEQVCSELNYFPSNLHTCVDEDTVAYWSFDGTAEDRSGNGNDGELFNGPVYVDGFLGNALQFDGVNDYFISTFPLPAGGFTIEYWIKPTDGSIGPEHPFGMGGQNRATIYLSTATTYYHYFKFDDSCCGGVRTESSITPYQLNEWQYIRVTWNGTAVNGYFDGSLNRTTERSLPITYADSDVVLGNSYETATNQFEGVIDEVRISNIARTF